MAPMAQTKRKRRSKHRGNAAGVVESRGRTGRRPTAEEARQTSRESARERRMNKPPSWNSAFLKAALMAGLLFLFTQIGVFGSDTPVQQSIVLCVFAVVLYTPLAYVTDRWVYQRAQRRKQQQQQ
jgi:drug/metabolite transporter (DMT)-like permease